MGAEPLVGRRAEVEMLAASLEAAAEGQPRFVLVAGEAGIGKTRLLREAADLAAPLGLNVLRGTAIEGGRGMPYLALLAPLADRTDGVTDAPSDLVRRLITGEPSPDNSDAIDAARLAHSVFTILVREPTLLLVDDVHWADSATVTLLDYLGHRARSESLAVVVGVRDDDTELLARLPFADGRTFTRLSVGRLSRAEVAEQVEALLGSAPEPELVAAVFERSAGNPFFVEQLLATSGGDAPASLRALVLSRLVEFRGRGQRAIAALAIVGRPADEAVVAAVGGIDEQEASEALQEAARRGVTRATDEGFAFSHPLFSEVVLAELAGSMRRRLHRAAAVALGASGAHPAEIATHWWEAGDPGEAWAAALEAAEHAERAFAFAEMRLHLERALEVWPSEVDGRPDCLLRAADAAYLAGDATGALAQARRAYAAGASNEAELHIALGNYAWDAGEHAIVFAAFERAAALVRDDTPPTTRSRALWGLARARIGQGRFTEAQDAATEAVAIAHAAGDSLAEARGLFARGLAQAFEGNLGGLADIERGVALAAEGRSPVTSGHGYMFLASLLHVAGELERALSVALEGIERCDVLGVARTHGSDLRGHTALILLDLGRWDEAAVILEPAEAREVPLRASALLSMRRGHPEMAELQIEAAAVASAVGGPGGDSELHLARAELAWLRADPEAARSALDTLPDEPGVWGASVAAEGARLAARLAADDPRHKAQQPGKRARHTDPRLDAALRAEIAAELTRASGVADPQLWAASSRAWTAAGRVYDRTYSRLREAEALFAVGVRGPATEALREAAATASGLGARPLRALADDLARRARVSPEPPRSRQPDRDEPTPRELDVLALLAEGLTNREIGARLFVSPKTVSIHVSRLHRKLDAHTRGEAVAAARRRGILA